tara:strand:- start:5568 stop:6074 length:507 start_codon:yes stop_codon:yes gene_type:complete
MVAGEIINKVDSAGLITLDLQDFIMPGGRIGLDLVGWLDDGLIVKEVSFKKRLVEFDWQELAGSFVAVFCSKDVIIPPWAYLLVQTKLRGIARQVFFSDIHTMNLLLFQQKLNTLNIKQYENKRVFLKVCVGNKIPLGAFALFAEKLFPHVKSLFYGEPCSSIPLIKN